MFSIPSIWELPPIIFPRTTGAEKTLLSRTMAIRLLIFAPVIRAHSRAPSEFISIVTIGVLKFGSIVARALTITPPVNSGSLLTGYIVKYFFPSETNAGLADQRN